MTKYPADPKPVTSFSQTTETDLFIGKRDYSEFLPEVIRTEANTRFFDSTVNQLLSSGSTESLNTYWGQQVTRHQSEAHYNVENNARRRQYQFSPGTITRTSEGVSIASYINTLNRMENLGFELDNHDERFSEPGYVLDLPINIDMFMNFANYYWLDGNIPTIEIEPTAANPITINDIIDQHQYQTRTLSNAKEVEFLTGMKVSFTTTISDSLAPASGNVELTVISANDISVDDTVTIENTPVKIVNDKEITVDGEYKVITVNVNTMTTPSTITITIGHLDGSTALMTSADDFNGGSIKTEKEYFVENVGGSGGIELIEANDIKAIAPYTVGHIHSWDETGWDDTPWDFNPIFFDSIEENDSLNKSYIVMERWSEDRNPWARTNQWYSIHTLRETAKYLDIDLTVLANSISQAKRPIIEYQANMELWNHGDIIDEVNHIVTTEQFDALTRVIENFVISESEALQNNDKLIVLGGEPKIYTITTIPKPITISNVELTDGNPVSITTANNHGFVTGDKIIISGVDGTTELNGNRYTITITTPTTFTLDGTSYDNGDSNAMPPIPPNFTNYELGTDGIVIRRASSGPNLSNNAGVFIIEGHNKGKVYRVSDGIWVEGQTKTTKATHPKFNLYSYDLDDTAAMALSDFPNNDFNGSYIFKYKEGGNIIDEELGLSPVFPTPTSTDFEFEFVLENERFFRNVTEDSADEIEGFYFFRKKSELDPSSNVYNYDEYFNCWSHVRGGQRVPIIQRQISEGGNITFDLGTNNLQNNEYTVTYDNGFYWSNGNFDLGEKNPDIFVKRGENYTINFEGSNLTFEDAWTDPILSIPENYEHDKITYLDNGMSVGEIIVIDHNHERVRITKNNKPVKPYMTNIDPILDDRTFDDTYTLDGSVITVHKTDKNDIIEVRYITDSSIKNAEYEVAPINFYNPGNDKLADITQSQLANHFERQLISMVGFNGKTNGLNNYHKTRRTHNFDGLIRQQIYQPLKMNFLLDRANFNPLISLRENAVAYEQFKSYFMNKVQQLWETKSWNTIRELVDAALADIHIGKNKDFKYSNSDMAFWHEYTEISKNIISSTISDSTDSTIPASGRVELTLPSNDGFSIGDTVRIRISDSSPLNGDYKITAISSMTETITIGHIDGSTHLTSSAVDFNSGTLIITTVDLPNSINTYGDHKNHIQVWSDNDPLPKSDYAINGDVLSLNSPSPGNITIRWYQHNLSSFIPYSTVKLGFFKPPMDSNGNSLFGISGGVLTGHDGSKHTATGSIFDNMNAEDFDVITASLWDLETRIFNNLVENDFDMTPELDNFDPNQLNKYLKSWYNRWAFRNNVTDQFPVGDDHDWKKSSDYQFARASALLYLKPYSTIEKYWEIDRLIENRRPKHSQWYNKNTCDRTSIDETHNLQLDDHVLIGIDVVDGGSYNSAPTITFPQGDFCSQRAEADISFSSGEIQAVTLKTPGRFSNTKNIRAMLSDPMTGNTAAELSYRFDNKFKLKKFGWNSLTAEEYGLSGTGDASNDTKQLFKLYQGLSAEKILHVGGFTDKKLLSVHIDGSYNKGPIEIPPTDYEVILDENAPFKTAFFSGVKIEKITSGYKLSGYDLDNCVFNRFLPSYSGRKFVEEFGSTKLFRYANYQESVHEDPYGIILTRKQELFDFLLGVGEYFESVGFRIRDRWRVESLAAIQWSLDNENTKPFYMNGIEIDLIYEQGAHGLIQSADVNYTGLTQILDRDFNKIKTADLLVLRNNDTTEFSSQTDIFGLKVRVIEYEHHIAVKNKTEFDDHIYAPELGFEQTEIKLIGERTRNWNGKFEAPGFIVQNNRLVPNIESSVREIERDWVNERSKAFEPLTRQTLKQNVGFVTPPFLQNINENNAYQFEKGFRNYKGTTASLKSMDRNKNVFGDEFETEAFEEWLIRLGDYGDTSQRNPLEWVIDFSKTRNKSKPHFRFNEHFRADSISDNIIDLVEDDGTYVSGNYDSPFSTFDLIRIDNEKIDEAQIQGQFNKDAGLPLLDEIDYTVGSIDNVNDILLPEEYSIPNWNNSVSYTIGDQVRIDGKTFQLDRQFSGIDFNRDSIIIRSTEVFPVVENDQTLIINDNTITFRNFLRNETPNPIVITGNLTEPYARTDQILEIDGVNLRLQFVPGDAYDRTTLADNGTWRNQALTIPGNLNPTIHHNVDRKLTIYWADSENENLNSIDVIFEDEDDKKDILSLYKELIEYFIGQRIDIQLPNDNIIIDKISTFESFRIAYIESNSITDWQTWLRSYFDSYSNFINVTLIEESILANQSASWINEANAFLLAEKTFASEILGKSVSEFVAEDQNIINGDEGIMYNTSEASIIRNFRALVDYLITNGNQILSSSLRIVIPAPNEYATSEINDIVTKINDRLDLEGLVTIRAENVNNRLLLIRRLTTMGNRLGVSEDNELGFLSEHADVLAQPSDVTYKRILTVYEVVAFLNRNLPNNVFASVSNDKRLVITSTNTRLTIGSETANENLGLIAGIHDAEFAVTTTPDVSRIADIVRQINAANIQNLVAEQVGSILVLYYDGQTLAIGDGTANTALGLQSGSFDRQSQTVVENVFIEADWTKIPDPAHFNIWVVDNIGSTPTTRIPAAGYSVYQTIDLEIGIEECCAGIQVGDDALVKTSKNHNLNTNDIVLILNSTCQPSIDGIHKVSDVIDDTTFLIDEFIQEKGFTGKIIPLRKVRFNNSSELESILTNPLYRQNDLGIKVEDVFYVDDVFEGGRSTGKEGVYELFLFVDEEEEIEELRFRLIRTKTPFTQNDSIKNGRLVSSNRIITDYEVYDPLKGYIPGIADKEIDIRSEVDIAYYTDSTSIDKETNPGNAWGDNEVGTVWWDLSTAIYLNYDQGGLDYKRDHWGELFPTASIDIYEWTKSPMTPDAYMTAVNANTIIDGVELTGVPYTEIDRFGDVNYHWSEDVVLNQNNQHETYYYFWVRQKTTVPNSDRIYSVLQLEEIITDPLTQNVNWLAASSVNTLIISGLLNTNEEVRFQVNFDRKENDYHQEFLMVPENDPSFVVPEWLHLQVQNGLVGKDGATERQEFSMWGTRQYQFGDIVSNVNYYEYIGDGSSNDNPEMMGNTDWMDINISDEDEFSIWDMTKQYQTGDIVSYGTINYYEYIGDGTSNMEPAGNGNDDWIIIDINEINPPGYDL